MLFKKLRRTIRENDAYRLALRQWLHLYDLETKYWKALSDRDIGEIDKLGHLITRQRMNCIEVSRILLHTSDSRDRNDQ